MTRFKVEICVVGGGPAGSIIGRQLALLGHETAIIDRFQPTQWHKAESLAPSILSILDSLDLSGVLATATVQREREALIRWESNSIRSKAVEFPSFLIQRSVFDQRLRELTAKAGALVLSPARARTPERIPSGGWLIPTITSDGTVPLTADFLVDARGKRRGVLVHQGGPSTVALSAAWKFGDINFGETRIEAAENEWFWGCALRDRQYLATIFLDPARIAGLGEPERERLYRKLLSGSELLADLLHGEMTTSVIVRDATSRITKELIGHDFIRTGEAAFSIDPLSSQGVQRAILSAIQGGAAVHTIRTGQDSAAAMAFYRDRQYSAAQQANLNAIRLYKESRYHLDRFWTDRYETIESAPSVVEHRYEVPISLPSNVRLSDALQIVDAPVLSGSVIRPAPALSHPRLEQPIAYLGGIALAPLAADLADGLTSEQLLTRWTERMPSQTACYIFRWMCAYGILEGSSAE
jgi:flavin-dependent dehydrogenase